MEVQLQLDENGRTLPVPAHPPVPEPSSEQQQHPSSELASNNNESSSEASPSTTKKESSASARMDFSSKAVMTSLCGPWNEDLKQDCSYDEWRQWMDDILFDCDIADCGLMPRTFWVSADEKTETRPRCVLEQMALDVFHHHVMDGLDFDPTTSGAEWWVQIRPSPPKTGRYSMHDPSYSQTKGRDNDDNNNNDMSSTGISFHWDKDEDLRLLAGGSLYVHPYLSTVTYLTDFGAPTMAVNCRVDCTTGEWIVPHNNVQAFVSWPKQGKHLSFDGRFLHAAPPDLMPDGVFAHQCTVPIENEETRKAATKNKDDSDTPKTAGTDSARRRKVLQRRHRRVTFLVNVWLNYKPFNVEPFPETMIDKMTRIDAYSRAWKGLFTTPQEGGSQEDRGRRSVIVQSDDVRTEQLPATLEEEEDGSRLPPPQLFTWPMGDCNSNETIRMQMPLKFVRHEATVGGNVRIQWKDTNGVCLCKEKAQTRTETSKTHNAMSASDNDAAAASAVSDGGVLQSSQKRVKTSHDDEQ